MGQVAINTNNSDPDGSAMLDISSSDRGVLIPRMSSDERENINNPANGLMVYDMADLAFYYFNGQEWLRLSEGSPSLIEDKDSDTKIEVEQQTDEDKVRVQVMGNEIMTIDSCSINSEKDLFIDFIGYSNNSELSLNYATYASGGYSTAASTEEGWQSFIAEKNGKIGYIRVRCGSLPSSTYSFAIHEGEGINGNNLGTSSLNNPNSYSWNSIDFSEEEIILTKGKTYTVWFNNRNTIAYEVNNPFPNGMANYNSNYDFNLRVYTYSNKYTFAVEDGEIKASNIDSDIASIESDITIIEDDITSIKGDIVSINSNISEIEPVGIIQMWPTSSLPSGCLLCNGSTFNASTYPELGSLLGSNTLPNFSGRFPLGVGNSGTSGSTTHNLNGKGGEETHVLNINEMPSHNHGITYTGRNKSGSGGEVSDLESNSSTVYTENTGGGQAHNNMPPFYTINFIIKAE